MEFAVLRPLILIGSSLILLADAARIIVFIMFSVSLISNIGQMIFQITYAVSKDAENHILNNPTLWKVLGILSWQRINSIGSGLRIIIPDLCVSLFTLILIILDFNYKLFNSFYDPSFKYSMAVISFVRMSSMISPFISFLFIFLNGILLPGAIQAIYWIILMLIIVSFGFSRKSLLSLLHKASFFTISYNIFNILVSYSYQFDFFYDSFSYNPDIWGLYSYKQIGLTVNGILIIIYWTVNIGLLIITSFIIFIENIKSSLSGIYRVNAPKPYFKFISITKILYYNWILANLFLIACSLISVDFFGVISLLAAVLSLVLPREKIGKLFTSIVFVLVSLITTFQYIYSNSFFEVDESDFLKLIILTILGFKKFPFLFYELGIKTLTCFLISIDLKYRGRDLNQERLAYEDSCLYNDTNGEKKNMGTDDSGSNNIDSPYDDRIITHDMKFKSKFESIYQNFQSIGFYLLERFYLISFPVLYIASVHQVNIFNLVYLIIFMVFLVYNGRNPKYWIFLMVYDMIKILIVYVGSIMTWFYPKDQDNLILQILRIFSLETYPCSYQSDSINYTCTYALCSSDKCKYFVDSFSLFKNGLLWYLIVMLNAIVQFLIANFLDLYKSRDFKRVLKLPNFVNYISKTIFYLWINHGLILIYLAYVLVATLTNLSFINISYMIIFFICCCVHIISRRAEHHIKRFWIFIMIWNFIVLLVRYLIQLKFIANHLINFFPKVYMGYFGIETDQKDLHIKLLWNTLILILSIIRLETYLKYDIDSEYDSKRHRILSSKLTRKSQDCIYNMRVNINGLFVDSDLSLTESHLGSPINDYDSVPQRKNEYYSSDGNNNNNDYHPTGISSYDHNDDFFGSKSSILLSFYCHYLDFIYFLKRLFILHFFKFTILIIFLISVFKISAFHFNYYLFILICTPFHYLTDSMGLVFLIYTEVVILLSFIYQFGFIQNLISPYQFFFFWIGLYSTHRLFDIVALHLVIMIVLILQRFARRWKNDWIRIQSYSIYRFLLLNPHLQSFENADSIYIKYINSNDDSNIPLDDITSLSKKTSYTSLKPLISRVVKRCSIDLFICKKVYPYYHDNEDPENSEKSSNFKFDYYLDLIKFILNNFLTISLSNLLFFALLINTFLQYRSVFGLLSFLAIGMLFTTPKRFWESNTILMKVFIFFAIAEMLFRYIVVMYMPFFYYYFSMIVWAYPIEIVKWFGLEYPHFYIIVADYIILLIVLRIFLTRPNILKASEYWKYFIGGNHGDSVFQSAWTMKIRYLAYRYFPFAVLFLTCVNGLLHPDLMSLGYVLFGLLLNYKQSIIYLKRNKIWTIIRAYNYIVILCSFINKFPILELREFISDHALVFQIIGINKFSSQINLLFDLVLLGLITLQYRTFEMESFDILRYILDEEDEAIKLSHKKFQQWKTDRLNEFKEMERRMDLCREELKSLKLSREKSRKKWRDMCENSSDEAYIPTKEIIYMLEKRLRKGDPYLRKLSDAEEMRSDDSAIKSDKEHIYSPSDPSQHVLEYKGENMDLSQDTKHQGQEQEKEKSTESKIYSHYDGDGDDRNSLSDDCNNNNNDNSIGDSHIDREAEINRQDDYSSPPSLKKRHFTLDNIYRCVKKIFYDIVDLIIDFMDYIYDSDVREAKPNYSRFQLIFYSLFGIFRYYSDTICYMAILIAFAVHPNLLMLVYPLSIFFYALLENPRPSRNYWKFIMIYTIFIILLRYVFQLPYICTCPDFSGAIRMHLESTCKLDKICFFDKHGNPTHFTFTRIFGLENYRGVFFQHIIPELTVFFSVFIHRLWLKKDGLWSFSQRLILSKKEELFAERQIEEIKNYNESIAHQSRKRAEWLKIDNTVSDSGVEWTQNMDPDPKRPFDDAPDFKIEMSVDSSLAKLDESISSLSDDFSKISKHVLSQSTSGISLQKIDGRKSSKSRSLENEESAKDFGSDHQSNLLMDSNKPILDTSNASTLEKSDEKSGDDHIDSFGNLSNISQPGSCFKCNSLKKSLEEFIYFLISLSESKPGYDLYATIWFFELIAFIYIILFPSIFIGEVSGSLKLFFVENRLPSTFVFTLLVQFILIIIERIIYLYRAIRVKIVYHLILVVFYHVYLIFVLPMISRRDFISLPLLVVFYILKCAYMFFSSLQIMYGYPQYVGGQILTNTNSPSIVHNFLYLLYRAIPFVYELRTLLDWTVTRTSLRLLDWFKFEDIYANLFLVKCRVNFDLNTRREVGDSQKWYLKFSIGFCFFVLLVMLIWFPLLLIMQGSVNNVPNDIIQASFQIGIEGCEIPMITTSSFYNNIKPINTEEVISIRNHNPNINLDDLKVAKSITLNYFSDTDWMISSPAYQEILNNLKNSIENELELSLYVKISFKKSLIVGDSGTSTYDTRNEIPLTVQELKDFMDVLKGDSSAFSVNKLLPRFFYIPNVGNAFARDTETLPAVLSLNNTNGNFVWYIRAPSTHDTLRYESNLPWDKTKNIVIITFLAEVPQGILKIFVNYGLIGLYLGVIFAVARFLRIAVTDLSYRIIYQDMPVCDELLLYCENIFLARQSGDLVLEESLYGELIEIYRSPETIISKTVRKGPKFAEKKKKD